MFKFLFETVLSKQGGFKFFMHSSKRNLFKYDNIFAGNTKTRLLVLLCCNLALSLHMLFVNDRR